MSYVFLSHIFFWTLIGVCFYTGAQHTEDILFISWQLIIKSVIGIHVGFFLVSCSTVPCLSMIPWSTCLHWVGPSMQSASQQAKYCGLWMKASSLPLVYTNISHVIAIDALAIWFYKHTINFLKMWATIALWYLLLQTSCLYL